MIAAFLKYYRFAATENLVGYPIAKARHYLSIERLSIKTHFLNFTTRV